ncbi:non-ribosomal peptide synthetase [Bacillus amyloliquefaciens]|uniref:non-ribosomal peptide synthetase n=1 Tax=Bacillus amyloliquefaciens TaxID=1390 RepID=UPI000779B5A1|nr:non-ribosomal peptide synthetase [Bacillus amyloliquefaciens]KYC88117.1 Long-chain-fatty-acid--CoA ligase [Bacillus amyloliquefaciens]
MNENELLMGFKSGKYTADEVLAYYQELDQETSRYTLSEGQKGLWMLHKLEAESDVYHIPICFRVRNNIDREKLKQAFGQVVIQHDQLACAVVEEEGVPYLVPQPFNPGSFSSSVIGDLDKTELISLLKRETKRPIDLARDSFIRMHVYSVSSTEHVVLIVVHHLVFDGASTPVFLKDLFTIYESLVKNNGDAEPSEKITYGEFLEWEQNYLSDKQSDEDRQYWLSKLEGELRSLNLDIEKQNEGKTSKAKGETLAVQLTDTESSNINLFCSKYRVKPAAFFLSLFQSLLQRYTGENDLIIGIPTMGRPKLEFYQAVGYFVNTLPLRKVVNQDACYSDYLTELNYALAEAVDHSQYPFPCMVQDLDIQRNAQTPPVFQITYTYQNKNLFQFPLDTPTLGEIEFVEEIGQEGEFKLSLEVYEEKDHFVLCFKYDANQFDAEDIKSMMNHYQILLAAVMENPDKPIGSYNYLSIKERNQVLIEWNRTSSPFPSERCLHELFEEQVMAQPDAIALEFEGESMSYVQLNERANQVAAYLRQSGVSTDTIVAICVERSFEMVVGLLGIVKAGGAYMPIDPAFPVERIRYMLENAGVQRVLTSSSLASSLPLENMDVTFLETDEELSGKERVIVTQPTSNISRNVIGLETNNLAYVIYTSGSTGLPKAVMVEHRALTNRIDWMQKKYKINASDVILQKTPYSFDVSVWEFFLPLISGARLVLASPNGHTDPEYLISLIKSSAVTTLHFVPSMFRVILGQKAWIECRTIRRVFCSGEALAPDLVLKHYALNSAPLFNLYGPTEAAIDVSHWHCSELNKLNFIPIGKPIQNVKLYVLNDYGSPQAVGCRGQLYIGGDCLARGYLNNPELTREKFIPNPFSANQGDRLYKTGDVVRWLKDGSLEYSGRNDDQTKIRGIRIELGEIEAKLNELSMVETSLVMVREDSPGEQRIVAYIVLSDCVQDNKTLQATLNESLKMSLPDYMIPSAFVILDDIPVTVNGKVNRSILPTPESNDFITEVYVAPRTQNEKILVDIWSELLGFEKDKIGVSDNFFALGGHSLLIPKLLARLQLHGLSVDIGDVFESSTLTILAEKIDNSSEVTNNVVPPNKIPANCKQIMPDMITLVTLNENEIDRIVSKVPGGTWNIQDIYPLAPLQEGILFHHMMDKENDPYVLSGVFSFEDRSRLDEFVQALQYIIDRNDVLRTAFVNEGISQPVQVVYRRAEIVMETVTPPHGMDANEYIQSMVQGPHNILVDRAPLIQLKAARDSITGMWYLLFNMHHLIDDATSLRFLFSEIVAYLKGEVSSDRNLTSYREFIGHAINQMNSDDTKAYFEKTLGDVNEPTLPFGIVDVYGDGRSILDMRRSLPCDLSNRIRTLAKRMHFSPASIFHAAWAIVTSVCAGKDDIVFGTVLSGRLQGIQGAERMLGNFINTLPMRAQLANKSVKELLEETDVTLRNLIRYEKASLSLAQSCSGLDSNIPLFGSLINYRFMDSNERIDNKELEEFGIKSLTGVVERTNYPLLVSVDDQGDEFSVEVQAVQPISCDSIHNYFKNALEGLVNAMAEDSINETSVSLINILPDSECEQVMQIWNNTEYDFPDKCIHQQFQQQVLENPNRTAVVYKNIAMTYEELGLITSELSNYLICSGLNTNCRIAVIAERSIDMVVGLLGVLKSGAAYIPIDPEMPEERLTHILLDSNVSVVLSQNKYIQRVSRILDRLCNSHNETCQSTSIINLENRTSWTIPESTDTYPTHTVTSDSLAYIMYTSGTTGNPKGVCITHRSVMNTLHFLEEMYPVTDNDAYLLKTNYSFDVSVSELFGWFMGKGHLVILPPGDEKSSFEIIRHIEKYNVTHVNFVPSMLREFVYTAKDNQGFLANCSLKYIMVAGEAFPKELAVETTEIFNNTKVENIYGPTEASIYTTYYSYSGSDMSRTNTPIGRPIANTQVYIVDSNSKPMPIGVPGELCIAGVGLAQGYLNNTQLTQEKFINNPFEKGSKLYRTGDLARWLPDGNIEYLGRLDFQVKIRGFRIELGEIEYYLNQHPAVHDTVVVKREIIKSEEELVAYPAFDSKVATACHNILSMLEEGQVVREELFDLQNGMTVCGVNRQETELLYQDQFIDLLTNFTLKKGDSVLDVGANIGMFSLQLASRIEGLQIYSFEPIPEIYNILSKNSNIIGANSITPVPLGLSNANRRAKFDFYPEFTIMSGKSMEQKAKADIVERWMDFTKGKQQDDYILSHEHTSKLEKQEVDVSLTTVSDQIRRYGLTSISLLRIDVNYCGLEVMDGIEEQDWKKINQMMISVNPKIDDISRMERYLKTKGYELSMVRGKQAQGGSNLCNLIAKRTETEVAFLHLNQTELKYMGPKKIEEMLFGHLRIHLPGYMIPAKLVFMRNLPLNQVGKIDRKALPMPKEMSITSKELARPENQVDELLISIWAELLNIEQENISVNESFFNYGGHSLLLTRMLNRIKQSTGVELPLKSVFNNPTISAIAIELQEIMPVANENTSQLVDKILEGIDLIEGLTEGRLGKLTFSETK